MEECVSEKPTPPELSRFALRLVSAMRGHSRGLIWLRQLAGWPPEEIDEAADLILKELREGTTEELEALYRETCGVPFKEAHEEI